MKLPSKGTILAPASLHLPLYHEIYQQHGSLAGLQVLSMEAFLNQFAIREQEGLLFEASRKLDPLLESNSFSQSFQDKDFLSACIGWLRLSALLGISAFPDQSQKDKDLKAVLESLSSLDLAQTSWKAWLDQASLEDVYILQTRQDSFHLVLQKQLVSAGAQLLTSAGMQEKTFLSASNIRKCLEVIASRIIDDQIPLQKALIALASPEWMWVTQQVLESRNLPYTFLHPESTSAIPAQFGAILRYIRSRNKDTWLHLVRTLFPASGHDVLEYHELFGTRVRLQDLEYEDNPLISPLQFEKWLQLEARADKWMAAHQYVTRWNLDSLEEMGRLVQNLHPEPTEQDLALFDQCISILANGDKDRLDLMIQMVESLQYGKVPDQITGIAVGSAADISALHDHVFYAGPHAALFPGLETCSGLFDELVAKKAGFPPLADRLQEQRDNLYASLSMPSHLYVVLPQSDYKGKSLESAYELEEFMGQSPEFVHIQDKSVWKSPSFLPRKREAGRVMTSNALDAYQKCPLRHYLRYELGIRKSYAPSLKPDRRLMEHILLQCTRFREQSFEPVRPDFVRQELEKAYAFAKKLFPDKASWFDLQMKRETRQVLSVLEKLDYYQDQLHLDLLNQEYAVQSESFSGPLRPYAGNKVSFSLGDADQIRAVLEFEWNERPESCPASVISYKKSYPQLSDNREEEARQESFSKRCMDGLVLQDLAEGPDWMLKKPTPAACLESIEESVQNYQSKDDIAPVHEDSACKFCPYGRICRNASRKKGDVHAVFQNPAGSDPVEG